MSDEWKQLGEDDNPLCSEEEQLLINLIDQALSEPGRTILHCSYTSRPEYVNGGWININPNTYLWNRETGKKLHLQHAIDIPVSPKCHFFKHAGQEKNFTLIFPLVPRNWKRFTFVEVSPGENGFVVYDIERNSKGIYRVVIK